MDLNSATVIILSTLSLNVITFNCKKFIKFFNFSKDDKKSKRKKFSKIIGK